MNKLLAALIATVFATAAIAQTAPVAEAQASAQKDVNKAANKEAKVVANANEDVAKAQMPRLTKRKPTPITRQPRPKQKHTTTSSMPILKTK